MDVGAKKMVVMRQLGSYRLSRESLFGQRTRQGDFTEGRSHSTSGVDELNQVWSGIKVGQEEGNGCGLMTQCVDEGMTCTAACISLWWTSLSAEILRGKA